MRISKQSAALGRAAAIILGTVAAVSGVTFASLQSQAAVLKGNTIETASAGLQVSTDGTAYASSVAGYFFGGLIPGGQAMPTSGYTVYVKDSGSSAESVSLSVPAGFSNTGNLDLTKVHLILTPVAGGASQNITIQQLIDAAASGGVPLTGGSASHLTTGNSTGFFLKMSIDSDATINSGATVGNLDFNFIGTAVS